MKRFLSIFLILIVFIGYAQIPEWQNPNFRIKKFKPADSIFLDSLFILKDRIVLRDNSGLQIPEDQYKIDFENSVLYLQNYPSDSIEIEYYIHPELRKTVTYPKDPKLIVPSANESTSVLVGNETQQEKEIFAGLETHGSMIRGITFGNNQGSSVQSSLDLQINGQLSVKVGIRANISDTNVPIEADGYTQNLEQFDRVFVELFTDRSSARAGHVDLEQTKEYFLKFNRRVTGMQLKHNFEAENSSTHLDMAGSIARGEFMQFRFNGNEGNQGPYRLGGNQGEAYVIILAGSERIYKNGFLLQRGENLDYVMNYNTGEITFTNKHLIRSTDRFTAEYQYTNRSYNRFAVYGGVSHTRNRFSISSHIYSESDSKNNAVNQTLSEEDREILSQAGDDLENMYAPTAQQVPFEEGKVLYRKIFVNGTEIFEYSTDPNEILYEVTFSQLGDNRGNYILSEQGINGRVFVWVAPLNGIPQGSFEPVRLLTAPNKKQIWSAASSLQLKNNGQINVDAAISNVDRNLFSEMDDSENLGMALKLNGNRIFKKGKYFIQPVIDYEFIQKNFSPLERLRSPEFARDFNLIQELGNSDQHFIQAKMNTWISDSLRLNYGFDYLNQTNFYEGTRHKIGAFYLTDKTAVNADFQHLNSRSDRETSNFLTYNIDGERRFGFWKVRAGVSGESNVRRNEYVRDSLSFRWNEIYTGAMTGDTISHFADLRLYYRTDDSVRLGSLSRYSSSLGAELLSQLIRKENHNLRFLTHYRTVNYEDSLGSLLFLNATLQWRKSLWKKAVDLGFTYEIAGGTELQRAFTYVQVADGLGIYKWMDFNEDGIQQLDEFEVAEFSDQANFIRVYTNTVDQLKTNRNGLSMNMKFNPSRYLGNDSYWHRIQSTLLYSTTGNYLKNEETAAWNPWRDDGEVRSKTSQFYLQNKFNPALQYKWNLTHEFSIQDNTRFIFTGLESLNITSNRLTTQYRFNTWLTAEFASLFEWTDSESEAFASRRFELEGTEWIPKIYFLWNESLKSSIAYNFQHYQNRTGIEELRSNQLNFDFTWNAGIKTNMLAKVDWVKNDFTGNQDSVVGNRMMEGLRDGNNLVWQFLLQRNINSYLELNLQYSGRKNEEYRAVHTGNVQVRLNF